MTRLSPTPTGFAAGLNRLIETIRVALCKQNELEFSAPWKAQRPHC